ncbi:hypothetical protein SISSUDRAFT_1037148 [Sistotremastrum suecicum HHB10207 ss-3]|uniref:Uncharacterized protein n=1 Tax=Sistotremastrum suecicum HHB10207 ss-3 TaxID=1314776 RepID=A0A165YIW2_9AGAM|nr:hypothetical protein SISSUDRAFT_1037148 [Sistotremastrum suecicum HHB10207 ss-3]
MSFSLMSAFLLTTFAIGVCVTYIRPSSIAKWLLLPKTDHTLLDTDDELRRAEYNLHDYELRLLDDIRLSWMSDRTTYWRTYCVQLRQVRGELRRIRQMRSYLHQFRVDLGELERHHIGLGLSEATSEGAIRCALDAANLIRAALPPHTPRNLAEYKTELFDILLAFNKEVERDERYCDVDDDDNFEEILREIGLWDEKTSISNLERIPDLITLPDLEAHEMSEDQMNIDQEDSDIASSI